MLPLQTYHSGLFLPSFCRCFQSIAPSAGRHLPRSFFVHPLSVELNPPEGFVNIKVTYFSVSTAYLAKGENIPARKNLSGTVVSHLASQPGFTAHLLSRVFVTVSAGLRYVLRPVASTF